MTRTKPAEQRRADLLAAGEELFLAKGVAATSLDDITSRAGVSKGLFGLTAGPQGLTIAQSARSVRDNDLAFIHRTAAEGTVRCSWF
jgi:hypothetical protein